MMPLAETGSLGPSAALAAAPLVGFAFGWFLERGGLANARKLAGQFFLTDLTMFKVLFSALVTAMLGAFWLERSGMLDLDLVYVPETFALPQAVGGVLFGAGFLFGGLCPGTSCVAAASGRLDGLAVIGGMLLGFSLMVAIMWIFRNRAPDKVDKTFRKGQLVSAALYSLGHGGADAQKTMGIIAAVLVAANLNPDATKEIPLWVVLSCHAAIAIGTMSGGWRIVYTMGQRLTKLKPVGGFAAETAGAATLFMAVYGGIPVSTTHTITGAIVGVGSTRRFSAVRWGVARRVVWAWFLTIPASAVIAAGSFYIIKFFHG